MHYYFFNICCWKYYIGPPFPPINWFIMSVRYTLVPFHFPLKSPGLIEKLIFLLIGEGKKQTFEKMEGGNIRLSKIAVRPLSKQRVGGRFGHKKKKKPTSLSQWPSNRLSDGSTVMHKKETDLPSKDLVWKYVLQHDDFRVFIYDQLELAPSS